MSEKNILMSEKYFSKEKPDKVTLLGFLNPAPLCWQKAALDDPEPLAVAQSLDL